MKREQRSFDYGFWASVAIDRPDACWLWTASRLPDGYGIISKGDGSTTATRAMWAQIHGHPVPANLQVCHTCDNPPCVNPNHLWLGTSSDNQRDKVAKGRNTPRGSHCGRGHEFTPENTYNYSSGARGCRRCQLDLKAQQRAETRAA